MSEPSATGVALPGSRTAARWFGPADRPLLGWVSTPPTGVTASGVVLAPPLGYERTTSHAALRLLAGLLAGAGHTVLRFDYDGTGDAAGDQFDPGRVAAWRAGLHAAAAELRELGVTTLTLAGLRFGGLLALLEGAAVGADAVVAWAPVTAGRRYTRELRLLGHPVPETQDRGRGPVLAVAGSVFAADTLADLAALSLTGLDTAPAPRVLVVDDAPSAAVRSLEGLDCTVDLLAAAGTGGIVGTSAERAVVPDALVAAIAGWVGPAAPVRVRRALTVAPARPSATMTWHGTALREEVVALGPARLMAVVTEPVAVAPGAATLLLLNPGAEPHIGPGQAWVEYARGLAALGHRAVRADFRGWGDSPPGPAGPARPYARHCEDDVLALVAGLRAQGHGRVVVFGLCAAGWILLQAVLRSARVPLDGAIALNPQLYWHRGAPPHHTVEEAGVRRAATRERQERLADRGLWHVLDAVGHRPREARWLDALAAGPTPVRLLFSAGDPGLAHLRVRVGRRLEHVLRAPGMTMTVLPGLDHAMHRVGLRPLVLATLHATLAELAPDDRVARPAPRRLADAA